MKKKLLAFLAIAVVLGAIMTTIPKTVQSASDVPPDPLVSYNSIK